MTLGRTLFLKIFLWFCAVVLAVIVSTFIVGELNRPEGFRPQRSLDLALNLQAQTAANAYEREGLQGLNAFFDHTERDAGIKALLFDRDLKELSGRPQSPGAYELAQRTFRTTRPEFTGHGHPPLTARSVNTSGGQYVMVADITPYLPPHNPFDKILHVLIIGLVGLASCYGLALHLTSPVAKLRAATQRLADGDLSVRVTPALGNRRDELASLGADFDLMAEKIEALLKSQRRLLGDISHELRSPLARLNVALELAKQRAGVGATSALERIQREAENLNEMIGQLLTLTRLESGAEGLKKTKFELPELLREVADDADFEARSRNRSVSLKSLVRCSVTASYELLRRAIENVVRNAIQYTAEGTAVEIELRRTGDGETNDAAVITVRDHGSGVPESALKEIFRPFYRVDDARDREAGGVGLGLAIAERAVRLHGGSVEARNADGGGLVVTITINV